MKPVQNLPAELAELRRALAALPELEDFVEAGLAWLEGIAPYDLATIWVVEGDQLVVKTARGRLKSPKVLSHVVSLREHQDLRRVLMERLPRVNTEHDHRDGDGDLFDGVIDLEPGHSCMVVPLHAGTETLGLLSLDRNVCQTYSDDAMRLVDLYGRILAFGMQVTTQAARIRRLYGEERATFEIMAEDLNARSLDPVESLERSRSPRMRVLVSQTRVAAASDAAVMIRGETGSGKEVLAQAIHRWSSRAAAPFLKINCASIPEPMLESELFGHVKGAYTGATQDRAGRFRAASGGTLFLDEIGDMPLGLQAKLLRVLQEGTFEPVGSDRTIKVDVRIITATHVDLEAAIAEKRFREDLFYRINVFPVSLPALRDRPEDLPLLAEQLLRRFAAKLSRGQAVPALGRTALAQLGAYAWPGNVRELANVIERALILQQGAVELDFAGLAASVAPAPLGGARSATEAGGVSTLDQAMRTHIERALAATGGKIYGTDGAAKVLGLKPSTLQSKMKRLKLRP